MPYHSGRTIVQPQNNPTNHMSDCPHQHVKDSGLQLPRSIVRDETDEGRKIVRYLAKAMDGEFSKRADRAGAGQIVQT